MVNVKRLAESKYLRAEDVSTKKGAVLTVDAETTHSIDAGKFGERLTIGVLTEENSAKLFTLSGVNLRSLVKMFGEDTRKWVGKKFKVVNVPNPRDPSKRTLVVEE